MTPPGLLLDLGLQLHMLAILLLSAHFRKIVRGIDKMINGEPEPGERSSSNVPWDIVFMVAIVGLILLGSIAAILSGLFSLGDIFTLLLTTLWVIVLVGLGLWFRHYAKKVISLSTKSVKPLQISTDINRNRVSFDMWDTSFRAAINDYAELLDETPPTIQEWAMGYPALSADDIGASYARALAQWETDDRLVRSALINSCDFEGD